MSNRAAPLVSRLAAILLTVVAFGFTSLSVATESPQDDDYNQLPKAPGVDHSSLFKPDFKLFGRKNKDDSSAEQPLAHGSITILGETVAPASFTRLSWMPQDTFEGIAAPTPVLVLNGATPGPTLCLTGAVHGDEINGIEIIRKVFFGLKPSDLAGTIIGVPIVNQQGFRLSSRYLPDRRDLNRYFPGDPGGSSASRIAHSFFLDIVRHCDALVDIHTGSFHRTNMPQLRADMRNDKVTQLVHGFGGIIALHSEGAKGTLRRAAVDSGIASVTLEVGEPMRIQEDVVQDGVERILTLMTSMGIYKRSYYWTNVEPVYLNSRWVRSEQGGLLLSRIKIGDKIKPGDLLGKVVDPINNIEYPMHSPFEGRVIGMALNQVVMPGYAVYHIGIQTTEDAIEMTPNTHRSNDGTPLGIENGAPVRPDIPEFD